MLGRQVDGDHPIPIAIREQAEQWIEADGCLKALAMSTGIAPDMEPGLRRAVELHISLHTDTCGDSCYPNVRKTIALMDDPAKKRFYYTIVRKVNLAILRHHECPYRIKIDDDGATIQMKVRNTPTPIPFSAIEGSYPADPNKRGYVIFEVDRATFDDPRVLLQHLDLIDTRQIKLYPAEFGRLHWHFLISDRAPALLVQSNDKLKAIAKDWTLMGRYGDLAEARLTPDPIEDSLKDENRGKPERRADAVALIRSLALNYNEKSWFAGYVGTTSAFRKTDKQRALGRARRNAAVVAVPPTDLRGEAVSVLQEPESGANAADHAGGSISPDLASQVHATRQVARLTAALDSVDRKIVELKMQSYTEEEIAAEVGLVRETVCRRWQEIRKFAAKILK